MDIPFIGDILNFFQSVWDWLYQGIYDFVKDAFVLATKMMIYGYIQGMIFLLEVSYEVFASIMDEIGVSKQVEEMYSSLDADLRSALGFFGIPDALNIIVSAIGTRWTMKFIPFIGR